MVLLATVKISASTLLGKENMWKNIVKKFSNTESFVSLILGILVILVVGAATINLIKNNRTSVSKEQTTNTAAFVSVTATGQPDNTVITTPSQGSPTFPKQYSVKEGDTLWSIAEANYGSGYNWVDIAAANALINPHDVTKGALLTLPDAKPSYPDTGVISSQAAVSSKENKYTVRAGDNLWLIACASYTNCFRYPEIAKANGLSNASQIEVGQILKIPR